MKKLIIIVTLFMTSINYANADDLLSGDTKLACEAILCLSTSTRPSECAPSISRYFGIKDPKDWSKTLDMRKGFLHMCPYSDDNKIDLAMEKLIDDIHVLKTDCTADQFNSMTEIKYIGSGDHRETYIRTIASPPQYCLNLANNTYTDLKFPTYQCKGNYYSQRTWNKGYTSKYNAKGYEISRTKIEKNCWIN